MSRDWDPDDVQQGSCRDSRGTDADAETSGESGVHYRRRNAV